MDNSKYCGFSIGNSINFQSMEYVNPLVDKTFTIKFLLIQYVKMYFFYFFNKIPVGNIFISIMIYLYLIILKNKNVSFITETIKY